MNAHKIVDEGMKFVPDSLGMQVAGSTQAIRVS